MLLMFPTAGTSDLILWGNYFSKLPSDPRKILSLLIRTIKTSLHIIIYNCNSVKAKAGGGDEKEVGGRDEKAIDFEF